MKLKTKLNYEASRVSINSFVMSSADTFVELSRAVEDLSSRGLFVASRWAAEQLSGLDEASQLQGISLLESFKGGTRQHLSSDEGMIQTMQPRFMLATSYFGFKVEIWVGRKTGTNVKPITGRGTLQHPASTVSKAHDLSRLKSQMVWLHDAGVWSGIICTEWCSRSSSPVPLPARCLPCRGEEERVRIASC